MSILYIAEQGASVGICGGEIYISHLDGSRDTVPKHMVTEISIFGRNQLTASMMEYCLREGIRVGFFSQTGSFYGTLSPGDTQNVFRLKKQILLTDCDDFCLEFARKIVHAKIHNQITILRRNKDCGHKETKKMLTALKVAKSKIENCSYISQLMGYEGIASRDYFSILSSVLGKDFKFSSRSRRPARDPFNAMLNMGYSMLHKEIQGELQNFGLCTSAGFMHKDALGHASLASDMMEEWRPVIVDATIMAIIRSGDVGRDDFYYEDGACLIQKEAFKKLIARIEKKMFTEMNYLDYISKPVSFRQGIMHQCERLTKAIDTGNVSEYHPIKIR